ncbi:helix-turn-helix domain-containing protein [Weizmannia acidilactici]|uniref:helix-turn-helix domain-containing protein n=1 Tax=Weizmannia acidilactici TaxID=2607726 RepID=UPI00124CD6EB|nr:helix-turn-helix domain-containing protein [Weizmannia acidilactici]GER73451.1 hypothetical protein BpPP18_15180 [Weizmannia acidilactici]
MKEIDKYMTVNEAAERWGISKETIKSRLKPSLYPGSQIDDMINAGLIKYYQKPGNQRKEWIISVGAMEKWFGRKK